MAQFRLSAQIIGRSTGRSAVAAAAYRAGMSLVDERTGLIHDFSRRLGIIHAEIIAPDNAPDWMNDRAQLWNAVERVEARINSQLAREIQLSLPHELTDAQRLELTRSFIRDRYTARGVIADLAIHAPGKEGDDRNHHAHIMLTMRELTGDGFGKKARATMTERQAELVQERESWAEHQNRALEQAGLSVRVDHRSNEARGIDEDPQAHTGPAVQQMEQRGQRTRLGDENRAREARNTGRARRRQQGAVISLEIERERRRAVEMEHPVQQLRDAQRLSLIDFERVHDRQKAQLSAELESQYGAAKRTMQTELSAIAARAEGPRWKQFFRSVTGQSRRDAESLQGLQLTLANISMREKEAVASLAAQQTRERERMHRLQARQEAALKIELEYGADRMESREDARETPAADPSIVRRPHRNFTRGR